MNSATIPQQKPTDIVIHEWQKNAMERVRVALTQYRGYDLLDFRVWFDTGDGTLRPTKGGIGIRIEQIPELRKALEAAENALGDIEPSIDTS